MRSHRVRRRLNHQLNFARAKGFEALETRRLLAADIGLLGNSVAIISGDVTPSLGDFTDFNTAQIGGPSIFRNFTVQNTGDAALTLSGAPLVSLSGASAGDFSVTAFPSSSIGAGSSSSLQLAFTPTAIGTRTATVTIPSTDPDENPYTFQVQGVGLTEAPSVVLSSFGGAIIANGDTTPSTVDTTDFGTVDVSAGLQTQTFVISNFGPGSLNLSGTPRVQISGAAASDFTVVAQPPATVGANTNTTFAVQFDPSAIGTRAATISILSDAPDASPYTFAVQGVGGVASNSGSLTLSSFGGTIIANGDTTPSFSDTTDFGSVNVSSGAQTQTFVITNFGPGPLNLSGSPRVQISGANASDFSVTALPPSSIAAGTNSTFAVRFDPTAAGLRTATLTVVSSDGAQSPFTFNIQGTGTTTTTGSIALRSLGGTLIANGDASPSVSETTDFGTVSVASGVQSQTFVIYNNGGGTLNLTGSPLVQVSGANAADFSVTANPAAAIAAGGTSAFTVAFDPSAAGTRSATLSIASNDGAQSPYTFAIQGNGSLSTNSGSIVLSSFGGTIIANGDTTPATSDTTDFGSVNVASGTQTQTFVITNFGPGALGLTGSPRVQISGANASDFSVVAQPPASVAAGTNTTFAVQFDPSAAGTRTATVSIVSSDGTQSPYTFAIQGTGGSVTSSSGSITLSSFGGTIIANGDATPSTTDTTDFGNVNVAAGVQTQTFVITNFGPGTLNLSGTPRVQVLGANAGDFTVTAQPPANVAAGTNTTFALRFDPSAAGTRTAIVSIASSDASQTPFTFAVQGNGTVGTGGNISVRSQGGTLIANGDVTPSPSDNTDFGTVNLGAGTQTQTFVIQNTGAGTLNLIGTPLVQISGANASDFVVTTPPSGSIGAGSSSNFAIGFTPSGVGTRVATVTIVSSDASQSPYTFAIQGTGATGVGSGSITLSSFGGTIINNGDTTPSTVDTTDYGNVNVNASTQTQTFVITNFGPGPLNLTGTPRVQISGANAGDFVVVAQPPASVSAGTNATFATRFDPSGLGVRTATVTIVSSDAAQSPFTFTIQGNGVDPNVGNGQLAGSGALGVNIVSGDTTPSITERTDFGAVTVDLGTNTEQYFLTNTGAGPLVLNGSPPIAISGANAADFTVTGGPDLTLDAGQQTSFLLTFHPSAVGLRTATVTIASNTTGSPYTFAVQGTGTNALVNEIAVINGPGDLIPDGDMSPTTRKQTDFGSVEQLASRTRTFFILNQGAAPLNLTGSQRVAVSGPNASDFVVVNQPTGVIAETDGDSFDLRFTPSGPGVRRATITIVNDDSDESIYTFDVVGNGTTSAVSAAIEELFA